MADKYNPEPRAYAAPRVTTEAMERLIALAHDELRKHGYSEWKIDEVLGRAAA
jgi:hypothetical protein